MKNENSQIRLRRVMEERGLRQVDILRMSEPWKKKLGVKMSKNTLSQYLNGKSSPDSWRITLLAKTLDVNESWLLGYDVPMNDDKQSDIENVKSYPIIDETIKTMKQLKDPRQKVILDTAKFQLKEQQKLIEDAKRRERKILSLDNPPVDITKIPGYMPYDPKAEGTAPILGEIAAGYNIMAEENFDGMMPVSAAYSDREDIFWLNIKGKSMETLIHDGSFGLFEHSDNINDGNIGAVMAEDGSWVTVKRVFHEFDENGYLLRIILVPENEDCETIIVNEYNPAKVIGRLLEVKQFF